MGTTDPLRPFQTALEKRPLTICRSRHGKAERTWVPWHALARVRPHARTRPAASSQRPMWLHPNQGRETEAGSFTGDEKGHFRHQKIQSTTKCDGSTLVRTQESDLKSFNTKMTGEEINKFTSTVEDSSTSLQVTVEERDSLPTPESVSTEI